MATNYKQASTAAMYDQITGAYLGHLGLQGQTNFAVVLAQDANGNTVGLVGSDGNTYPLNSPILPYADQTFADDDYILAATGIVAAQRGYLSGVELLAGTGITLTLQDCPDAANGRQVWAMPSISSPRLFRFAKAMPFHSGLFATIGGISPSVRFFMSGSL